MIESFPRKWLSAEGKVGTCSLLTLFCLIFLKPISKENGFVTCAFLTCTKGRSQRSGCWTSSLWIAEPRDPGRDRPTIEQTQQIEWQVGSRNENNKFNLQRDGGFAASAPSHYHLCCSAEVTHTHHAHDAPGESHRSRVVLPFTLASKWKNRFSQKNLRPMIYQKRSQCWHFSSPKKEGSL